MKKIIISMLAVLVLVAVAPKLAHANYGEECRPTDFSADAYTIHSGDVAVLHWDSIGCDSARIDPADYPEDRPPYDTIPTLPLTKTTYFTLTVYDAQGNIGGQRFLTIKVTGDTDNNDDDNSDSSCRINDFDADDTSIEEGDETTLRWTTSGCDEVKINQGIGEVDLDGDEDVHPRSDTTYTLSAYDNGHLEDTDTVRINVEEDEEDSCSIDSFKADDYSIESGDSVRLSWSTTGASDVDLSPGGDYDADDSVNVRPSRTTTYELTANCKQGSDKHKSLTVTVGSERSSLPQAVTTIATITSQTTAQLNGIAFPNTNSGTTRAWFQWGPSSAMSFTTAQQTVASGNGPDYYNASVSGLVPGTTYYYRAVVQNQNGTAYGDTVTFKSVASTPSTTVVRTTQVLGSSVVAKSAPSLLELRVTSAYDRMCVGGQIDYTVTYRNISSTTLRDAVVQVNHQKEVTFVGSSRGSYDVVQRTVTIPLGDIAPGETGTIILHGRVNNEAVQGTLTVLTAQVVYTNSSTKAQESAIAYSLVTVTNDCPNVLGASVFGFGNFLPHTLIQWLLLILIILALIVLGRNLYKKPTAPTA
jgi:hypothetical protein